jgi:hypothetical protein
LVNIAWTEAIPFIGRGLVDVSVHADRRHVHETLEAGLSFERLSEQLGARHMDLLVYIVRYLRFTIGRRYVKEVVNPLYSASYNRWVVNISPLPLDVEPSERREIRASSGDGANTSPLRD